MTPYAEARATIDEIRNALTDRLCEFCGPAGVDPAIFFSAVGELFFNAGIFMQLGPNAGWFAYAPITTRQFSPGLNMDF